MKSIINDKGFEKYIRMCLEKETGEITVQDMEQIKYLDLGHVIFHDISAIKHCVNLREIRFAEDFSQKYDLSILKTLHNLKSVSLFNPKDTELSELNRYVNFTSIRIIFWGNVDIFDLNAYKELEELSILNFTGKAFSCKNISELTELRYIRLCSIVTDTEILSRLPKLEIYENK